MTTTETHSTTTRPGLGLADIERVAGICSICGHDDHYAVMLSGHPLLATGRSMVICHDCLRSWVEVAWRGKR